MRGNLKFGNAVKNEDGSISMILDEGDLKSMIISGISKTKTNTPIPIEMLRNLVAVKIGEGKVEIKLKVV